MGTRLATIPRPQGAGEGTFVSRMAEGQASDATIMRLAGHLSKKMMDR